MGNGRQRDGEKTVTSMMKIEGASSSGHVRIPNADCWGYARDTAWLLDGATQPPGVQCCGFGPEQLVKSVDSRLRETAKNTHRDLRDLLVDALSCVKEKHAGRHKDDVLPPGPAATVAVVRIRSGWFEWAVLGDAGIILGRPPRLVSDSRLALVAADERTAVNRHPTSLDSRLDLYRAESAARNRAGGYWVLADDPEAPAHALRGTDPTPGRVILASDGVHRHIGPGCLWRTAGEFAAAVGSHPPEEITARIRRHERGAGMSSDDATLVTIDTADHSAMVG